MDIIKNDLRSQQHLVILLSLLLVVLVIYFLQSHGDFWKAFLVLGELSLTFSLSYIYLRNDINDVRERHTKIFDIYKDVILPRPSGLQYYADNKTSDFTLISISFSTMLIFLTFGLFITFCCVSSITDSLQMGLIIKTIISVMIAFVCILIFGKTSLAYASGRTRELTHFFMQQAAKPETIMKYEELD